jgi:hypothetical protein
MPIVDVSLGPLRGTRHVSTWFRAKPSCLPLCAIDGIMGMPALTRRRYPGRLDCRHVYYGDVHVGTIAVRVGCPHDEDPWEWRCGFYPGSRPGEIQAGTAEIFAAARANFEAVWRVFLAGRTEADFQAWRHQRDATAWKYRMRDTNHRLPTQATNGTSVCFCGAELTIASVTDHIRAAHMEMAR